MYSVAALNAGFVQNRKRSSANAGLHTRTLQGRVVNLYPLLDGPTNISKPIKI